MALPPQTSDPLSQRIAERRAAEGGVFVREVDEAVRQDDMMGAMRRFGIPLLIAVVVVLAGLGGWLWWRNNQAETLGRQGEDLALALDQVQAGRFDTGSKSLEPLAAKPATGIGAVAAVMRGAIAEEQGKRADAVRQFAAVSGNADAPQAVRDLATVREVAAGFETFSPQQVIDRLKPLAVPGNPWFGNAGELVGMAYLKQGKRELAGPMFASIARDEKVPPTLRRRARQLAGLLGVDAVDDVAKASAEEGGAVAPQ